MCERKKKGICETIHTSFVRLVSPAECQQQRGSGDKDGRDHCLPLPPLGGGAGEGSVPPTRRLESVTYERKVSRLERSVTIVRRLRPDTVLIL